MTPWHCNSLQRVFLRIYLWHFFWVFLAVHLFLSVASTAAFWIENPFIPLGLVWLGIPDLVLVAMPLSVPFCALIAGTFYLHDIHRQHGFLGVQLAGRSLHRQQVPIYAAASILSLVVHGMNSRIVPLAAANTRLSLRSLASVPSSVAVRLAHKPLLIGGYRVSIGDIQGEALRDITILSNSPKPAVVIAAKHAHISYLAERESLNLHLSQGRLLATDSAANLQTNLVFSEMSIDIDTRSRMSKSKLAIISPKFYTSPELKRLREQGLWMMSHGVAVQEHQQRRIDSVDAVIATRIQSALLPVLFVGLLLSFCSTSRSAAAGRRIWIVNIACLLFLVPEQIYLQLIAQKNGATVAPILMFAPTFEVLAAIGLYRATAWSRRRRASC